MAVDRVSASEKGSLIIFSKVELRWTAAGVLYQDTFIDLTNDYPGDVQVQMYFINGDPPLDEPGVRFHPGWNAVDVQIDLTGNQPTYWSALTGLPEGTSPFTILDPGFPPGRPAPEGTGDRVMRGYIIAWAVDADGEEIRWNHLKGDALIVNYLTGAAWEYNAWAFSVVAPNVTHGNPTGTPGILNLDGTEYEPSFDQLLLDFYAVGSTAFSGPTLVTVNTDVTLFPVSADLRQETDGPVTTKASFTVWNMNETQFTGYDRCITCWDQELLSNYGIPNHFLLQNLQTNKGKARIDGLASQLCDIGGIISENASLLGVAAKMLVFGTQGFGMAGMTLVGMGTQNALIQADVVVSPPPEQLPGTPGMPAGRPVKKATPVLVGE
jgi:hypothetical protein